MQDRSQNQDIVVDPKRDAWATIRGFVYQIDLTVERWLHLEDGQVLELECGEDIDIVSKVALDRTLTGEQMEQRLMEQVKNVGSSVTLRKPAAIGAIVSAVEHRSRNPRLNLLFRYTTNAKASKEKVNDDDTFKPEMLGDLPAIIAWERIRTDQLSEAQTRRALTAILAILRTLQRPQKISNSRWKIFQTFISRATEDDLHEFIKTFEWSTGSPEAAQMGERISEILLERGHASDDAEARQKHIWLSHHVQKLLTRPGIKRLTLPALMEQLQQPAFTKEDRASLAGLKSLYSDLRAHLAKVEQSSAILQVQVESLDNRILSIETLLRTEATSIQSERTSPKVDSLRRDRLIGDLPSMMRSIVGRDTELEDVQRYLRAEDTRLVTIVGPPGVGKTRLAIQVAYNLLDEFEDGVCFVDLAPITSPLQVVPTLARQLDIRVLAGQDDTERVISHLEKKRMLLVLDNFEHLIREAQPIAEQSISTVLQRCPRLRMMVTSRHALRITCEKPYPLGTMSLLSPQEAQSLQAVKENPAVSLFVQRAKDTQPGFEVTATNSQSLVEICRWLDGLPLSIELVAARLTYFGSPAALLRAQTTRLEQATGGPINLPKRSQSLRGAIAWSYKLLSAAERRLFRRLAVFVGGFTQSAAQYVCTGDARTDFNVEKGLITLIDGNLLQTDPTEAYQTRYRMLESLREFALKALRKGEDERLRRRHLEFYVELAEQARAHIFAEGEAEWMRRLEADLNNILDALKWGRGKADNADLCLQLATALGWFCEVQGLIKEGRKELADVLAMPGAEQRTVARAAALYIAGRLATYQDDYASALLLFEESLAISEELGDARGIATARLGCALEASYYHRNDEARDLYYKSLQTWQELNDLGEIAYVHVRLGHIELDVGRYQEAVEAYRESLRLRRLLKNQNGTAHSLSNLARAKLRLGSFDEARELLEEAIKIYKEMGNRFGQIWCFDILGYAALHSGDASKLADAKAAFLDSLTMRHEIGETAGGVAQCIAALGCVACKQGEKERAERLWGAAEAIRKRVNATFDPIDLVIYHENMPEDQQELSTEFVRVRNRCEAMEVDKIVAYALELASQES